MVFAYFTIKAQSPDQLYFIVETMKSTPDNISDYEKAEKEVWKKIHQERVKRGLIENWTFYQVLSPSGTDVAYNYVTVTTVKGFIGLDNPYSSVFDDAAQFLTPSEIEMTKGINALRNLTTATIMAGIDYMESPSGTNAKFLLVNYMKIKNGGSDEYINFETKTIKPIHLAQMKAGKSRSAWGLFSRVLPGGSNQAFDFSTIDFYDNWANMNEPGDFTKTLATVYPNMTMAAYNKLLTDSRTIVNTEVWKPLISTTPRK